MPLIPASPDERDKIANYTQTIYDLTQQTYAAPDEGVGALAQSLAYVIRYVSKDADQEARVLDEVIEYLAERQVRALLRALDQTTPPMGAPN